MFLEGLIKRRLSSLLQPWLTEEPELDLQLGFINSSAIAKNIRFSAPALNQLIDDSSRLLFKEFVIEQLVFRFSNWSAAAFTFEAVGIHVKLSFKEAEEEGLRRKVSEPGCGSPESVKRAISEIDPEGSLLHAMVDAILTTNHSTSFSSSFLHLVLQHCYFSIREIHLEVLLPVRTVPIAYQLEIKDINAESVLNDRCFARGLVYVILQPVKEGSFDINVKGFEAGYKRSGNYTNVCYLNYLSSHVKLSNFKLVELNTWIQELLLLCSPVDFSFIFVLFKMFTKKYKRVRSGRQLWRLAASRISQLVAAPRFIFYNIICLVCLWLRYVGFYEHLLNQLEYSIDHLFERSIVKMSKDKVFLTSVKNSWQVISSLEEQLPVESIARARRLARFRVLSNCQCERNNSLRLFDKVHLLGLFRVIYRFFLSISNLFHQRQYLTENPIVDGCMGIQTRASSSSSSSSSFCFILSLGKFYFTIQPTRGTELVDGRTEPHYEIPAVLSFRFSIKEFLLVSIEGTLEQSLSLSCGKLKGKSFVGSFTKGKERTGTCITILHVDPARMFVQPEGGAVNAADCVKDKCCARIERYIGEMCFRWKKACEKYEASGIRFPGVPRILFELKRFLTHPFVKEKGYGLQKYCASIGKFNAVLEHSSIWSLILIIRQISQVLHLTQVARTQVLSVSQTTREKSEVDWNKKYDSFVNGTKSAFLKVLPKKDIELNIHIVGPHIQMFPRKHGTSDGNENTSAFLKDEFLLGFDLHSIEFVVWPMSKSDIAATSDSISLDSEDPESFRFQQPQMINIKKPNDERHTFQQWISLCCCLRMTGVKAYLEDVTVKQQNPVLVVDPIELQLSSYREFLHGFNTTLIFSSTTSEMLVTGLNMLLFMDELCALSQVIHGLCRVVSFSSCGFSSILEVHSQLFSEMVMLHEEFENGSTSMQVESLIWCCPLFFSNNSFKIMSLGILLGYCRNGKNRSNNSDIHDAFNSEVSAGHYLSECGIWISIHRTCLELLFAERKLEVLVILMEIQSITIPSQEYIGGTFDRSILRRLLSDSPSCLYELFCSHCILILSMSPSHNLTLSRSSNEAFRTFTSEGNSPYPEEYLHVRQEAETTIQSNGFAQKLGFASNTQSWDSNHWVLTRLAVSEIFVTRCSVKNSIVCSQPFNKLLLSLSVAGKFQVITCEIQGGFICLEVPALDKFMDCCSSFLPHVSSMLSIASSKEWQLEKANDPNDCYPLAHAQENLSTPEGINLDFLETFNTEVSQFSMILIDDDEHDSLWEFMTELDLILSVNLADKRRNFVFELHRLTISSQVLHESSDQKELSTSHFSYASCGDGSSQAACGSGLKNPVPSGEVEVQSRISKVFSLSHPVHIVKHLAVSLSAEKLENMPEALQNVWEGRGLVSGLDMTISLSELQRFLSIFSTRERISSENASVEPTMSNPSHNQEVDNSFEMLVPDGAIVAVQDVDQHMYFMVEGEENKYTLAGTPHYSVACERALFQVKHHFQRKWNSSVLLFSLTSLYAKNSSGRPLRLNSRPGLGFVDISSTSDDACSLWRVFPVEPDSYEGDIDWAPYIKLLKSTFHLVNKKNDCAVAFVDGVPEFVSKPGNPFKLKVLSDLCAAFDVMRQSRLLANSSEMEKRATVSEIRGERHGKSGSFPCISIIIEEASLTIVDELSHTKDRLPLLRGCINHTELTLHILATKSRVITRFMATLLYFDSQTCSWMEFLRPSEMNIFYRSRFKCQEAEPVHNGVPIHIYFRAKGFEIFLVELSLDILLYLLGKLHFGGPFSVKSSMIMANCCKVYNQTSLNLSCNFSSKQSVTVSGKQSASIFLRHSALSDQRPENAPSISFELSVPDSFMTVPVQLSLQEDRVLALRTRLVSVQDSQMHPGPVIVVEISRRSEDGLSIAVSPLICIHNGTKFSMELRFRRPDQENEVAFVPIKIGDQIEDTIASFEAINLPAGIKKALRSLSVGNILFSFRPEKSNDDLMSLESLQSVDWSEEIKGGKAVRLSGIFEKLQYEVRKAFSVGSPKYSFSTTSCTLKSSDGRVSYLYFLIQSIGREIPTLQPKMARGNMENKDLPVSLHEQKDIFLLPTVRVSNLLASNIHVSLDDNEITTNPCSIDIGKKATITCGSTADFYVNPEVMLISVTLVDFGLKCKALNSAEWTKKLLKHKGSIRCLDIDLDFGGAKILASLRLSRGYKSILEAVIYTSYTLKNKTNFSLFFFPPNLKPLSRNDIRKLGSTVPPELGLLLPPQSTCSWFLKSHKVLFKLVEDNASETLFDLDALSGQTEISLEVEQGPGVKCIAHLGVSVGPSSSEVSVPSQMVTLVPRHVVQNMSAESITVRQCNLQDEAAGVVVVNCKQTATLLLRSEISKRKEYSLFESLIKKHRNDHDGSLVYIQFHVNESQLGWSGPLCITSLGRFFMKFQKLASQVTAESNKITEYAEVHVVEEGPSTEVKFYKPPQGKLPYRIENHLHGASVTYYQKDSSEQELLGPECSAHYVWDDLTLPRKLVVIINNANMLREIKLDKVRMWRPFYKSTQQRGLLSQVVLEKTTKESRSKISEFEGTNVIKSGYEVYADGPMRVLRICEVSESYKGDKAAHSGVKIRLRLGRFAIHLLEQGKQDLNQRELPSHTPIVVARLQNIFLDSLFAGQQKYNRFYVQSLNVDEKWVGAPFASMLRQHQLDLRDDCALKVHFVLHSAVSSVTQITYSSVLLQPIDLNLDEDTMMKIVSFWRRSLSESTQSRQFYFEHFEVHPIKIFVNFVPSDSYSSYNSAQETLRSLLHSVIKVPPIKNMVVELNGILVTHALITLRELIIKCSQHYSWYAMRAIYIAKGSPLLPPAFASIFDDMSSSSLDVFFDPSRGLLNLPGFTLGTFKLLSKCIDGKGFSGTKRYLGDLEKTLRAAGSNVIFAAVTEISDSVLRGAETSGFDGMVSGFHHGILKLAMEPSVLGSALLGGGPDRKIKLDRSPGVDELYVEGYLQAMLDTMYRQEYLRVRVIDDQIIIKNLPPNSSLIDEIINRVKGFLISKALLKGDPSATPHPLHHLRGESEWRLGPTVMTLCEHLFVSYAIRMLRKQGSKVVGSIKWHKPLLVGVGKKEPVLAEREDQKVKFEWRWGITKFVLSGILAYVDGRLCRSIPHPLARRIVSGFLLSFLDKNDDT